MAPGKFSFICITYIFAVTGIVEVRSKAYGPTDIDFDSSYASDKIKTVYKQSVDSELNDVKTASKWINIEDPTSKVIDTVEIFNTKEVLDDDTDNETSNSSNTVNEDTSNWTYDEQDSWGSAYPECSGPSQSPINIRNRYLTDRQTSTCLKWSNYNASHPNVTFNHIDNTVEVKARFSKDVLLSGGPLTGDYKLASIRWHWGFDDLDGSEHSINSRKQPLEMHAIHHRTKYTGMDHALAARNDKEAVVIVAVLYRPSTFRSSPSMATITKAIESKSATSDSIILNELGLGFQRNYYSYLGSFTAPPCSPIVRWLISGTFQRIRVTQLAAFRSITKGPLKLVDTFRNQQSIEGRTVDHFKGC